MNPYSHQNKETKCLPLLGVAGIYSIFFGGVALFMGCYNPTPLPSDAPPRIQFQSDGGHLYDVVVIDDCQYLSVHGNIGGEKIVAHKGNCTNVIHVYSQPQ